MASYPIVWRVRRVDTVAYEASIAAATREDAIEVLRRMDVEEAPRVISRRWEAEVERVVGEGV
jgi:hypothetical protein